MGATLQIGGLGLRLEDGPLVEGAMRLPGFPTFVAEGITPHIIIHHGGDTPDMGSIHWLHTYRIFDGQRTSRFGRGGDGKYYYDLGGTALLACDLATHHHYLSSAADPNLLRLALWSAYSMSGLIMGRIPVHASVVVHKGRAVMCLGESGTGKSTHTALWMQHISDTTLLNDDSPILALADDGPVVYGSPWSGKGRCFHTEHYPVAALVRLEQKPANTMRCLGPVEAFTALQPSCPPCLMKDGPLQDRLVALIAAATATVPAYRLGCRPDAEAVRLAHSTIFPL